MGSDESKKVIVDHPQSRYSVRIASGILGCVNLQASDPPAGPQSTTARASLAGQRVAFTGTLASMTHREAQHWVEACGGVATENISRHTTLLVVGEEGWPLEPDGHPSVKLQQAQRLIGDGVDLRIASEPEWLGFVGLDDRLAARAQVYTPAMVSQLLAVSVHDVRRWERQGLIRAVRRVHRLPYFDLKQVASAQRLAKLLAEGVAVDKVRQSLRRLEQWMGDSAEPLAQLELLAQNRELAFRDDRGRLRTVTGQRLFDFDPPVPEAADPAVESAEAPVTDEKHATWGRLEWFEEGQRLSGEGELDAAVEALRMSLMLDYDFPEVHFHLADVLYRQGNERAALERFYMAAELDREYLEAWTQIGCVHAGLGEFARAVDAFSIALDVHPDYPDAHYHKAEALWRLQRKAEARPHFEAYLKHDQRGPWAEMARARLGLDPLREFA